MHAAVDMTLMLLFIMVPVHTFVEKKQDLLRALKENPVDQE